MILFGVLYKDEFLYSIEEHDFAISKDGKCGIDGGQFGYVRRIGEACLLPITWLSVKESYADLIDAYYNNNKIIININKSEILEVPLSKELEEIRNNEKFVWGTYGKSGKGKLKFKQLWELDTEHLNNILKTQNHISEIYKEKISEILKDRKWNRRIKSFD